MPRELLQSGAEYVEKLVFPSLVLPKVVDVEGGVRTRFKVCVKLQCREGLFCWNLSRVAPELELEDRVAPSTCLEALLRCSVAVGQSSEGRF